MATLESQYWKFLEDNPGSTLTFEEWNVELAKRIKMGFENRKNNLDEQLENLEMVRYRMENEGFHYCFKQYSSFKEVEDEKFHELRRKYLEISHELEEYVNSKINTLRNEIDGLEDII
jgi:hypothetical protein